MIKKIDRRSWLKSGALLTTGLALSPSMLSAKSKITENNVFSAKQLLDPSELTFAEAEIDLPPMKARLTSNENPFGPSEKAKEALKDAIDTSFRYGSKYKREFIKMIAEKEGVTPDHILLGAGSSELLSAASMYYTYQTKGSILAPDLTYESLIRTATAHGGKCERVPLTDDLDIDLDAMRSMASSSNNLVYLCNPNNPTGKTMDASKLVSFCESVGKKTPIFIDEAYIDYVDNPEPNSMIQCVKKGYNVMVARTFSKLHAFAGLRIGYMVALPSTIANISIFGSRGGTISATSCAAAMASYEDDEYFNYSREMNTKSKDYLYKTLDKMGYDYIKSATNFVFFPISMDGKEFRTKMAMEQVGVKFWKFRDQNYCRVSIGTMDDMKLFTKAFKKVVA